MLAGAATTLAVGLAIAQDQETIRLRSAVGAEDPRAPAYIAALTGVPLSSGNSYRVMTDGNQIFNQMLDAIHRATRRISFETYVYAQGDVARRFTEAFVAAARRGVTVNLIVDSIGAASMEGEHLRTLREAGCHVVDFNPSKWYTLEELNYRTHRKILVVDGEVGFTGGVGVADYWASSSEEEVDRWRDTHVSMRGPVVRLLEAAFYENFAEGGGIVEPALDDAAGTPGFEGASMVVRSAPTGGANELKRLYLLAIAMARRSVDITTPYFVTDESTLWAFEDAVGRGVKIRLLVESDITDAKPVKYASRSVYERLLEMGLEIYEYQPTMMHAKVLVVDGIWSMFGSANFDNRSLELNDELNVAVTSRELAERFLADFARDLGQARQLKLDEWRRRPFVEKSREKFWSYFGEVF